MEEKKHSKVGASSCKRWMNCPGSVALNETAQKKDSIYSAEGTVAHELCETILNGIVRNMTTPTGSKKTLQGVVDDARKYYKGIVGKEKTESGFKVKYTQEMLDACWLYVDTILADYEEEFKFGAHPHDFKYLNVEKAFHLTQIDEEAYGTNDASINAPFGKLRVYDFKYGKGIRVDAEENEQMMFYALGPCFDGDFTSVELIIIQPRVEPQISRWETTQDNILEFGQKIKVAISETRKPNAAVNQGDWCRFCDAKVTCPSKLSLITDLAVADFEAVSPADIGALSPEKISEILSKKKLIENWLNAVSEYAFEKALGGGTVPGYKLVNSFGNRAWRDGNEVVAELKSYGSRIYATPVLKSPAQMEKELGKESKELVEKLTEKQFKGVVLVPESDKREPVKKQSALVDFTDVLA